MDEEVTITSDGRIVVVSNHRCTFNGTPDDLAPVENGKAIKELILTFEKVITVLKEAEVDYANNRR